MGKNLNNDDSKYHLKVNFWKKLKKKIMITKLNINFLLEEWARKGV